MFFLSSSFDGLFGFIEGAEVVVVGDSVVVLVSSSAAGGELAKRYLKGEQMEEFFACFYESFVLIVMPTLQSANCGRRRRIGGD